MKKIWLLVLVMILGCTKEPSSPEATLQEFIEKQMGAKITREELLKGVTGPLREKIEKISQEEFASFSDLRNLQKDSFKILSKTCEGKKCLVTYSLTYTTKQEEKAAYSSQVEKVAEIYETDGKWLISGVTNIKTLHESLNPINTLED